MSQQYERDLVLALIDEGFEAFRIGGSGAGTDRPLPDIVCYACEKYFAIELKYSKKGVTVFDSERDIEQLQEFAEAWDMIPLLVSRFKQDTTFYSIAIDSELYYSELTRTQNIRAKKSKRTEYDVLMEYIKEI